MDFAFDTTTLELTGALESFMSDVVYPSEPIARRQFAEDPGSWSPAPVVEDLKAEKSQLEAASSELERLNRKLETVRNDIAAAEAEQGAVNKKLGGLGTEIDTARRDLAEARHALAEPDCEPGRGRFAAIAERLPLRQ